MSKTILIVDDEPILLSIFRRHLSKKGFAVLSAVSGEEALEIFSQHASIISTVILDINLYGELTGWDVVRHIQATSFTPKIVCMSGEPAPFTAPTINAFLEKPFQVRKLIELIEVL